MTMWSHKMHAKNSTAYTHAPTLSYIVITILSYGLFILFIVIDGIRYSSDLNALLFYFPYMLACYAMVRTIRTALRDKERVHVLLLLVGLFTFASLA